MPLVGTTAVQLKAKSSDRPEYMLQNDGSVPVKFDFFSTINFTDDSGFLLQPQDSIILSGRLAASALYAISNQAGNRILIADPGSLS